MATDSAIRRDAGIDPREYLSDMLLAVFARMFFGIRKEDETLDELNRGRKFTRLNRLPTSFSAILHTLKNRTGTMSHCRRAY
jgi:hypothetical protein